jgi:3-deoxy-7-phosphoheptulonate synthase/chorismate mutase
MEKKELSVLRDEIDAINMQILDLLCRRGEISQDIGFWKAEKGIPIFDPSRESKMLEYIASKNKGPFDDETIKRLFKQIFEASANLQREEVTEEFLFSRKSKADNTVIDLNGVVIGGEKPVIMAGPCSVESYEQMDIIASCLVECGVRIIRGGAFKPRTSPYTFQGLRQKGLEILREIANKYDLRVITEVMDPRQLELVAEYTDILQIGARNMHNYELLKELGKAGKPVMLKRGFMSTLEELLYSAEYILSRGNCSVILCERGIRTFEKWTRNTLDISAIPILKQESHLPIIVDVSHALGRTDVVIPIAKASLAAGADGIMVETHYDPSIALSDGDQQLNLDQFRNLCKELNY